MSRDVTLALDTTTTSSGVVVFRDGRVIAASEVETRAAASELLVQLVADVMRYVGVSGAEITRVVASRGPGAFTGIRVGLASARALALGWGCRVETVTAFDAVRAEAGSRDAIVLLDARRGQIYSGAPAVQAAEGDHIALLDPEHLTSWAARHGVAADRSTAGRSVPARLATGGLIPGRIVAGSALAAYPDEVSAAFPEATFRPDLVPSARGVALAAFDGLGRDELTPLYVRPPDARLPEPRS